MARSDSPTATPREISSRSVNDSRNGDHSGAGTGRRNPAATTWDRIEDRARPRRRATDATDSPASRRSHTSDLSDSDKRFTTHLLDETPQLSPSDATIP